MKNLSAFEREFMKKAVRLQSLAHPRSAAIRKEAQARLKQMFPNGRPRFGDARDLFLKEKIDRNPCTSRSLSTMPRRNAA